MPPIGFPTGGGTSKATVFRVARQNTTQLMNSGVVTLIQPDTILVDTANRWNSVLSRYVPNKAGYWAFGCQVGFKDVAVDWRLSSIIRLNGVSVMESNMGSSASGADFPPCSVFGVLMNGTTNYVDFCGFQNSGLVISLSLVSPNQFFGFFIGTQ